MIPAYPLQWPAAWKRTGVRSEAKFNRAGNKLNVAQAVERVRTELERMGVNQNDVVVSTNVPLRLDGWPRSDTGNPGDPGAAVYWVRRKQTQVMAIDTYYRVADNLAAIAACLDAMRALDRHGGEILNRAFTGFTALPAPDEPQWWDILECERGAPLDEIHQQYRNGLIIKTLEGEMSGPVGNWLIRGVKGELYSCAPDIFAQTYEALPEASEARSHG